MTSFGDKLSASEGQLMWRIATLPSRVAELTQRGASIAPPKYSFISTLIRAGYVVSGRKLLLDSSRSLRTADLATTTGGSLVIDRGPSKFKAELGAWGELGSAATIMSRIKSRLDPDNLLSPGRFDSG